MILSIFAYGQPVLREMGTEINKDYPELTTLIANMWETMYHAEGVGLAAPQIGLAIRLFIADTIQTKKEDKKAEGIKKVFINARKIEESGKAWEYEEGCLSIPDTRGKVERPSSIRLEYYDENFERHEETFSGIEARVIQHEYDHIEGVLFVDKLKPLKKEFIKRRLEKIRKGEIDTDYKMKFYKGR